jgi:TonB-dependent Receptor Plug Domain
MLRILGRRSHFPALCTFVLALILPSRLLSQSLDSSTASSRYTIAGDWIRLLPLDRAADVLTLEPGVTTTQDGELLVRGGGPGDAATYLDGVPMLSAFRSRPFFGLTRFQSLESSVSFSPVTVDSVTVVTGPLAAPLGNGQSGAILFNSRDAAPGLRTGIGYETDELFGAAHSFGTNRVLGSADGTLGKALSFFGGGMLEGQRSVATGFDSEDAPIFVSA